LKKKDDWVSTREIAEQTKLATGCVIHNLKILYKYNEVLRKIEIIKSHHICLWRYK